MGRDVHHGVEDDDTLQGRTQREDATSLVILVLFINGIYPQGRRISIGIFGTVVSTIHYGDLVLSTGAIRGEYGKRLNDPLENVPDDDFGENPHVEPYHYQGNPDN